MTISYDYVPNEEYDTGPLTPLRGSFTITRRDRSGEVQVYDFATDVVAPFENPQSFSIDIPVDPDACGAVLILEWVETALTETRINVTGITVAPPL